MVWVKWNENFAFNADKVQVMYQNGSVVEMYFDNGDPQNLANTTVSEVLSVIKKAQKGTK